MRRDDVPRSDLPLGIRVPLRPDSLVFFFFFFNDTATTEIYTLSLHDALPISCSAATPACSSACWARRWLSSPSSGTRCETTSMGCAAAARFLGPAGPRAPAAGGLRGWPGRDQPADLAGQLRRQGGRGGPGQPCRRGRGERRAVPAGVSGADPATDPDP